MFSFSRENRTRYIESRSGAYTNKQWRSLVLTIFSCSRVYETGSSFFPPFSRISLHYPMSLLLFQHFRMDLRVDGIVASVLQEKEREILEPRVFSRSESGSPSNRERIERIQDDARRNKRWRDRQTRLEWRTKIEVWSSQTPMKRRHETLRSFDQGGRIGRVSNDNYIITVCMRERKKERQR